MQPGSKISRPYESPLITPISIKRNDEKFMSFKRKSKDGKEQKNLFSYGHEEEKHQSSMMRSNSKHRTESNYKGTNESMMQQNIYKLFSDINADGNKS